MDKFNNIDSLEWLSSDKEEGTGRGSVVFSAPSWTGREDRLAIRVVRSGKSMKAVSIKQLGVKIDEISVDRLEFPISGGDKQIILKTNSSSVDALITSEKEVRGLIKAFTTANGLSINVNDKKLVYGFPGDPGLNGEFEVSLIISMGDNTQGYETEEILTINGKTIVLVQPGKEEKYLDIDTDFEEVDSDNTHTSVSIKSNIESYTIEIVECDGGEGEESYLDVDKTVLNFDSEGEKDSFNITTKPEDLSWEIK